MGKGVHVWALLGLSWPVWVSRPPPRALEAYLSFTHPSHKPLLSDQTPLLTCLWTKAGPLTRENTPPLGSPHGPALQSLQPTAPYASPPGPPRQASLKILVHCYPSVFSQPNCELRGRQAETVGPLGWVCRAHPLARHRKWLNICLLHE